MKKATALICAFVLAMGLSACGKSGNAGDEEPYEYALGGATQADEYDADFTDGLLSMGDGEFTYSQLAGVSRDGDLVKPVAAKTPNKYVGLFYFMWHGTPVQKGIYDISKILEKYAGLETDTVNNPLWALSGMESYDENVSPMKAFHYFEEPLYGYYHSSDKWVIKKHLELFALAGIDFLYLDFTNANVNGSALYKDATVALLDCILEMQQLGYNVPKIVPMCCSYVQATSTKLNVIAYVRDNYYLADNGKYKSCWFTADPEHNPSGKPLLCVYGANTADIALSAEAQEFWLKGVTWPVVREAANEFPWNVTNPPLSMGFPWMDWNLPQENYGGIMNVSVAQHVGGTWSSEAYLKREQGDALYKYRARGTISRSQDSALVTGNKEYALHGYNFSDQWKSAIGNDDVWMVTVTGWNEWTAQKLGTDATGLDHAVWVDTFDMAFSRDIEMMRDEDGYGDNYWLLLCKYVREFKYGTSDKQSNAAMWKQNAIDFKSESAWSEVKAKYVDFTSDASVRNTKSASNVYTYTDDSARNDIDYVKLCNDSQNLYVFVKTKDELTAHASGDTGWMNLYISTGKSAGWENYDFLINRYPDNGKTSVEALGTIGGKITANKTGEAEYATGTNWISYKISLKLLNVHAADEIQIKACDNVFGNTRTAENDGVGVYEFGNINAFYTGGDCAPMGRLNYAYRMAYGGV